MYIYALVIVLLFFAVGRWRRRTLVPKTLVIVMGNCRGGEQAWRSLDRHVLKPYRADLALVVSEEDTPNSLFHKAKYIYKVREYNDWGDVFDRIDTEENLASDWRQWMIHESVLNSGLFGGIHHKGQLLKGSGAIIFAYRYFVKKLIVHHNLTAKYDQFIITRSDHFYECDHEFLDTSKSRHVYVPHGEEYGGVTDRHILIGRDDVLASLDVVKYCLSNRKLLEQHPGLNPERLLLLYYKDIRLYPKIIKFDRSFYTVKQSEDSTRWASGNQQHPGNRQGLFLKYADEYKQTQITCGRRRGGQKK